MNKINNTVLCLTLVVLLSGCASTGGASEWIGSSENQLLAALGQPDNTAVLHDGGKILTWNRYETLTQVVPCRHSYTIDPNGVVSEFVTSNCEPKPLFPTVGRPKRGF